MRIAPADAQGKSHFWGEKFVRAHVLSVRMLLSRVRFVAARMRRDTLRETRLFVVCIGELMDDDDLRSRERRKRRSLKLQANVRAKLKATFLLLAKKTRRREETKFEVICEKVLELDAFKNARRMCVYIAHPKLQRWISSVLIREALIPLLQIGEEKVKVYVPIVDDKNSNVRFLRIRDMEKDLEKRTMGIMEPTELDWRTNEQRARRVADLKESEKLDLSHRTWFSVRRYV